MKPFEILRPTTLNEASDMLASREGVGIVFAGGSDLLGEMKEGTKSPDSLVDIGGVDGLRGIETRSDGLSIGSLTTLAEVAGSAEIARSYPALSQAAASVATLQIRNVGTLGGNLCQRPRCWYYRSPLFDCLKKGGDTCFAYSGNNKYHAILGADRCHIVHPSDTAVALMSLDAQVEIFDGKSARMVSITDFFVGPDVNLESETVLTIGEIVTRVILPAPNPNGCSVYLKAKERQAYDFALASVGAYLELVEGRISNARITLGGVAPVPYPVPEISDTLEGVATDLDPVEVGKLAVKDAKPMTDNGYKLRLTSNLVARAIRTLLDD